MVSEYPCVACALGQYPMLAIRGRALESISQAAHITAGFKRGMGQKSSDEWVIPLCGADKQNHHAQFDADQYGFALGLLENVARKLAKMSPDNRIRACQAHGGDYGNGRE